MVSLRLGAALGRCVLRTAALLAVMGMIVAPDAQAQLVGPPSPSANTPFMDARISQFLGLRDRSKVLTEVYARTDDSLPVLIEFLPAVEARRLSGVLRRALKMKKPVATYQRYAYVEVDSEADLSLLLALESLVSVKLALAQPNVWPLRVTREQIGIDRYRGSGTASDLLTGAGVTVFDTDAGIDVFHPRFFSCRWWVF